MLEKNKEIKKKKNSVEVVFNSELETIISEILSISARMKKRAGIRRYKFKMKNARRRALMRRADSVRINRRARRAAVNNMKKKFAGGTPLNKLSFSAKARVEKLAQKRQSAIKRNTRRQVIIKRALDRNRKR